MFKAVFLLCLFGTCGSLFASAEAINSHVRLNNILAAVKIVLFGDQPISVGEIESPILKELYQRSRSWESEDRAHFSDGLTPMPDMPEVEAALNNVPPTLREQGKQQGRHFRQ